MSTKITMALMAAVIACASLALAGGDGNRDTEYTYKTAQSAYRNLMNFRARQGSTAERGAVTAGVEMYRKVCTRIRVGVWGLSQAPSPVAVRLGEFRVRARESKVSLEKVSQLRSYPRACG